MIARLGIESMEYDNIYMGLDDTTVALVSAMLAM